MNRKSYHDTEREDFEFNNSIEEKIQQLKHDIEKTERKILSSEKRRKLSHKPLFALGSGDSDLDSVDTQGKMAEFYASPLVERIVPSRKLPTDVVTPRAKRKILNELEQTHSECAWASPSEFMKKRANDDVVPSSIPDDYLCMMDVGPTSPISLDFGLVSPPKKIMASPPQRIGRAQNREWSSPHRIIDRPNPESSPGSWVPVRVSHHMIRRPNSPDADIGLRNAFNLHDYAEPWIRPASQATFTVPDKVPSPQPLLRDEIKIVRKSTVLAEFEPSPPEKYEVPCSGDPEYNGLPSKVKRYSDTDGNVVKVSKLNDFDFGAKSQEVNNEPENPSTVSSKRPEKIVKGSPPKKKVVKKTVITCDIDKKLAKRPDKSLVKAKESTSSEKIEPTNLLNEEKQTDTNVIKTASEKVSENEENKENNVEKMNLETNEMMKNLEHLLKDDKVVEEKIVEITARSTTSTAEKSAKPKASKPTKSKPLKKEEEVKIIPIERKRPANPKAVQDYIKQQKQKRIDQTKTERERKSAEMESRKKKLEELRIKSLQLANASKKKKSENPVNINSIKIIDNDEEKSLSMSLGLKQLKPKLSYNESVLNLKKKTNTKESPKLEEVEVPKPEVEENQKLEEKNIPEVDPEAEIVIAEKPKPTDDVLKAPQIDLKNDLNITLKKLAETLKLKMDQKEERIKSRATSVASKSVKDPLSQKPSQESLKPVEDNKDLVAVDVETIQTLKEEFKMISRNFQTLHEIILNNAPSVPENLLRLEPAPLVLKQSPKTAGDFFKSAIPQPHPYNVITAVRNKWQLKERSASTPCGKPEKISITSRESSIYAEPVKYSSDFEPSSDKDLKPMESTTEENYYSMKDNSGSDFSSSILDSDKLSVPNKKTIVLKSPEQIKTDNNSIKESIQSSVNTDLTRSSVSKKSKLSSYKENLILVPPDLKLISNDKINISSKSNDIGYKPVLIEDLNNMVKINNKDSKSESTIAEIIDNLTESDRSIRITKRTNEQPRNRQIFFNPEAFHLQFQAELTLLETFQQSLSHFLEMERMKTITEVNRVVNEKAINTEKIIGKDDIAVQTSFIFEKDKEVDSIKTESVKTEIENESESIKTEIGTEPDSTSVKEETDSRNNKMKKREEKIDSSDSNNGISFQMLERMMKDEELRSEHQLALIRLRERTLNEKVKAELTFLEMKKKALKEIGSDEDQNISAIKKKQRGILLKYQSEKEEIERLKKMHKIASDERKIMIKQQKQIQKMQVSTKDMLIKLKRKEKSPKKRIPVKPKALRSQSDSQSEIPEDIPDDISESILTETVSSVSESIRQSIESDFDISTRQASDEEDEILRRNTKTIEEKISRGADKLNKCKKVLGEQEKKLLQRRHSVEELLKWKKRLEEEENRLGELERQAMNVAKHKKSFRDVKISMRDTSTSPFHFQEVSGKSESSITEALETKKSSSGTEQIDSKVENVEQSNEKTEESSVPEKIQSSASEDIPEEFSKQSLNNLNSRTIEYNSESFESPSSSETPKSLPALTKSKSFEHKSSNKGVTIKQALSPRIQGSRRRYSSGSDESINFSYTETASEQSDVESRITALHEQLRRRKLEAERLRREQKKAHRERLKAKEQSLIKQIQAYDTYIQKKKQELEQEYEYSSQAIVKPLIKQPKVAEKAAIKRDSLSRESIISTEGDTSRLGLQPNLTLKKKDFAPVDKESDNEISESIQEASETTNSITEQIDGVKEEEEVEVAIETESKDETEKSSSISESIPKQDATQDDSQSESEEQSVSNVSVKTTLHSPEKPDERSDTIEKSVESATVEEEEISQHETPEKQISLEKDAYSTDSFESDFDNEKSQSLPKESEEKSARSEASVPESTGTDVISEILSGRETSEELPEKEELESESIIATESKKIKDEVVENITDSILNNLLRESVKLYEGMKREEKSTRKIDKLTDSLANEIISDAIKDMCGIYGKRMKKVVEEPISPDRITSEVRRRIHEIMSLTPTGGMREQGRPQDLMKTTYDVSPVSTTPAEEARGTEHEEFLSSLSMVINKTEEPDRRKSEKEIHVDISSSEATNQQSDVDAYGQEWFDDDFGLSRTRKEAEELRLQQLQIEQEIQQLQAQQQQEQVPYYYLREIPNKPPPPYTPPGKAPSEKPSTEADITAVMTRAVKILTDEMNSGKEISTVEVASDFFGADDSKSVKCYKVFLFDLAKHILSEVLDAEKDEEKLPWMRTNERLSKFKCKRIERTFESLNGYVIKKVLILFGFRQKVGKESLIVRWSRKKRDHVDELLVSESQEEESQWTRYDKDQVTVKNEVTTAILDTLIDDTVQVLVSIFNKKKIAV